jgi:hypothetical protein
MEGWAIRKILPACIASARSHVTYEKLAKSAK